MFQLTQNFKSIVSTFSAIWQRQPIIFVLKDQTAHEEFLKMIFILIPECRQLITCGAIPKTLFYEYKTAKKLSTEDLDSLFETLDTCYQEDGTSSLPIQLVYPNARVADFRKVLLKLKHGWITTTFLSVPEVLKILKKPDCFQIQLDAETTILLPAGPPGNMEIEEQVLRKCLNKTSGVIRFMLQMKMSKIRFIGKAFLDEMEKGSRISQVAAQQQFEIDELNFNKVLELLRTEHFVTVNCYIDFISPPISRLLKQIIQLNGVLAVLAMEAGKPVAFEKKHSERLINFELFTPYLHLLQEAQGQPYWGQNLALIIKIQDDIKLLFYHKFLTRINSDIQLAFYLDANAQIAVVQSEIDKIFNQENVK